MRYRESRMECKIDDNAVNISIIFNGTDITDAISHLKVTATTGKTETGVDYEIDISSYDLMLASA